jgi:beta-1,4-mannosyltransferase
MVRLCALLHVKRQDEDTMKIISVPTENFRNQNPIFHLFYAEMQRQGVEARDFRFKRVFDRDLELLQIHFPEHFAMNYPPVIALARSCALLSAMLLCRIRRVPVVWTVHNVAPFESRNMALYRLLMAVFVRLIDGCVFLSRSSQAEFQQRFPRARPRATALIGHPAYPIRTAARPDSGDIVLGMIGEQKLYKQPLQALRLFETAHRLTGCRLLIAGKVHDDQPFREALAALPSDRVQWLDRRLDDSELEQAAAQVDFALLPYSMITNSGAAIYALSCERPVIVTPLPLFFELREQFGPAWVRIADGSEAHADFWASPTPADREMLRRRLDAISLPASAAAHIAFFRRLQGAARQQGEKRGLDKRRPAA